ncbi:beta-galactosidase [Glycomyces buryatensis]|uniref:Beta-galactosidase n=1 Tax=Glycomyces buryatensis TaxID=2570927 RepID=A0A4S8PU46_9ACTN|nr:beta-galactosidase [Glycomyces buryatensis]THV33891.1 beta-galactosidase [Glycomyces buryatensis]
MNEIRESAVPVSIPAKPPAPPLVHLADGLAFGGDYNPEQFDRAVWDEDVRLMREAGVNLVTLGVFAWGTVEVADGVWDWSWLDDALELLHRNGIGVDLATPTAAPPSWLLAAHPDIAPVLIDGYREPPGGRNAWCPASPVYRRYALRHVEALAERFGRHPAVRLWHVGNELGGGNARCYCDGSAEAFREWLKDRRGSLDEVNAAWGTDQWGHRFGRWEEILPPRGRHGAPNPGLFLDYERYNSDALLSHYLAEKEVLQRHSDAPVTTNLMVGAGAQVVDYASWAPHTAVAANDHYTLVDDPLREQDLAFAGDRMRGMFCDRRPWLLMESSTGGPSWQQRNRAKDPGEIVRHSLGHVARGSDGAMFFQWRASTAGAEQFHSAMLPHSGTRSRVWREVVELGGHLRSLAEIQGTTVEPARAAIVVDDVAGWALRHGLKPHRALSYGRELRQWHRVLWERGILCDVVSPWSDFEDYDLVIVPTLLVVSDENSDDAAQRLRDVPVHGGTLVVTYLSGICDADNQVIPGGFPGAFRDVLGAWSDEFYPLQQGEQVTLDNGAAVEEWTERVYLEGAEPVLSYATGPLAGGPAVTRHAVGEGAAWYVSAHLAPETIDDLAGRLAAEAGLEPVIEAGPGVEAVRRVGPGASYLFLLNHSGADQTVAATGHDLLTGTDLGPVLIVPAGGVRVLRESAA